MIRYIAVVALLLLTLPAYGISLEQRLDDPQQEARAQNLFKQLRCVVCTSESIHDSNADLAKDLRKIVREKIAIEQQDEEILTFIVARYGDSVLMQPPLKTATYLLWFGPALFFGMGVIGLIMIARSRR